MMMAGANRYGGNRDLRDRSKGHLLSLPYATKRVKRRVKPDQVSSYNMRVHQHRTSPSLSSLAMKMDRSLDPGEYEFGLLDPHYRGIIKSLSNKTPDALVRKVLERRPSELMDDILTATLAWQLNQGKTDDLEALFYALPIGRRERVVNNMSRGTIRHIVRDPVLRSLHNIPRIDTYLGELALNANSIYRQGTDVFRELLPYVDNILGNIDYADTGRQQLFNTGEINVIPSATYPTNAYGVREVKLPLPNSKLSWVFSHPDKNNIENRFKDTFDDPKELLVNPVGYLPKYRFGALSATDKGLSNKTTTIPWNNVEKILAGFIIRKKDSEEQLFIPPVYGQNELTPDESAIRQRIFSLTSRKPTSLVKQMKERGVGGYGDQEIDIYNEKQYFWDAGRRTEAQETDVNRALFPHPLIRYTAIGYRDCETSGDVEKELCGQVLATLPLVQK